MQRAVEVLGDLGHGQAVEVAHRERGLVLGGEHGEGVPRHHGVEADLPRVLDGRPFVLRQAQLAVLALEPAPVVHQLVAGHAHQPGHAQLRN